MLSDRTFQEDILSNFLYQLQMDPLKL